MAEESHIKIVPAGKLGYSFRRHLRERFIETFLFMSAVLSIAIMLAIIMMLVKESFVFFQHVSIWYFCADDRGIDFYGVICAYANRWYAAFILGFLYVISIT